MLQFSLANCVEPFLQCVSFSYWQTSSWILTTARKVWRGLKLTQTVTPIVNSDLLRVVIDALERLCFIACFYVLLKFKKHTFLMFFLFTS